MKSHLLRLPAALIACAIGGTGALAAPGEDPVVIRGKVSYLQMPGAAAAGSSSIVHRRDLPDHAKAKIARYMAKSYAPEATGIQTEKDVVSSVRTQSGRTTCTQTLAPATSSDPSSNDQVVVIRGDLVNICN